MNELFKEIEDDLRQEQAAQLWRRAGRIMLVISAGVILATIVGVAWNNHKRAVAMGNTDQFLGGVAKLEAKDYPGAIAAFDALAKTGDTTYYQLALLRKAEAERLSGDASAAQKTYGELADRHDEFSPLAAMRSSDQPIKVSKNSPFYYPANEWNAWTLLGQGKKDEAATRFLALLDDPEAPGPVHVRAEAALKDFAPEKLDTPAKGALHD